MDKWILVHPKEHKLYATKINELLQIDFTTRIYGCQRKV
jgi:hypothetical protein